MKRIVKRRLYPYLLSALASIFIINLSAQDIVINTSKDSLYIYDDFSIEGTELTNENGSTGEGWSDNWTYQPGHTDGVLIEDGFIIGSKSNLGIKRDIINPIDLGNSTFYTSFVMMKNSNGGFKLSLHRDDGIERFAIGVNVAGNLTASVSNTKFTSNDLFIEPDKPYFVVARWKYSNSSGTMAVSVYDDAGNIPETEPATWSYGELQGGVTGILAAYVALTFETPIIAFDDLKIGDTWKSVTENVTISNISLSLLPPGGIYTVANSVSTALFNWSDTNEDEDGYIVYKDGVPVDTLPPNTIKYQFDNLSLGQEYVFGVSAFKGNKETGIVDETITFDFDAENYIPLDIEIDKVNIPPTVDGIVDELWNDVFKNRIKSVFLEGNPNEKLPEPEPSKADFTGTWSALWSTDSIYFLFEALDDSVMVAIEGDSGGDIFDFHLAPDNDAIVLGWVKILKNSDNKYTFDVQGGTIALQNSSKAFSFTTEGNDTTGIVMEFAMSLNDLFGETAFAGKQLNLDVRYNDIDNANGIRDTQCAWTDKNVAGWRWDLETSLGSLTLKDSSIIVK